MLYFRDVRTRSAESRGQLRNFTIVYFPAEYSCPNLHPNFYFCNELLSISKNNTLLSCAAIGSRSSELPQNMARTPLLKITQHWPRQRAAGVIKVYPATRRPFCLCIINSITPHSAVRPSPACGFLMGGNFERTRILISTTSRIHSRRTREALHCPVG